MSTTYYTTFDNPLCKMTIIGSAHGIQRLYLHTGYEKYPLILENDWVEHPTFFNEVIGQLEAYATGERHSFDVMLDPAGTDFQKSAWLALKDIPYGQVRSYKEQAATLGKPKASRAIGAANGKNPIPILIPCHRVWGSNGQLTGFAFGLEMKEKLIQLESEHRE